MQHSCHIVVWAGTSSRFTVGPFCLSLIIFAALEMLTSCFRLRCYQKSPRCFCPQENKKTYALLCANYINLNSIHFQFYVVDIYSHHLAWMQCRHELTCQYKEPSASSKKCGAVRFIHHNIITSSRTGTYFYNELFKWGLHSFEFSLLTSISHHHHYSFLMSPCCFPSP